MAGPNVIQSEEHIFKMCRQIKQVTDSVGVKLIFKSSFDKANRTSAKSFRGPGIDEGLKVELFFLFRPSPMHFPQLISSRRRSR
jgi:2-dehydro-3-deoxyphosphooctonate aldolase (KDO 8-P synthase)